MLKQIIDNEADLFCLIYDTTQYLIFIVADIKILLGDGLK